MCFGLVLFWAVAWLVPHPREVTELRLCLVTRMQTVAQCSSLEAVGWALTDYEMPKALLLCAVRAAVLFGDSDLDQSPLFEDCRGPQGFCSQCKRLEPRDAERDGRRMLFFVLRKARPDPCQVWPATGAALRQEQATQAKAR